MFESARIFPPFTVKIGDISGDSFDRGQITENGDCPRKSGTSGHLTEEELDNQPVWYIPHHGVYHPQRPGKIRVVFDCSARFKDTSLNDHLLTGPELTNTLVGVLCRFRKGPIAIMCDAEKMFHVRPEHQDYLRFSWWENGDLECPP